MLVSNMEIAMVIKQRARRYHSYAITTDWGEACNYHNMAMAEMHLYPANWKCTIARHGLNGFEVLIYEGY